jgi:hypothetical protein
MSSHSNRHDPLVVKVTVCEAGGSREWTPSQGARLERTKGSATGRLAAPGLSQAVVSGQLFDNCLSSRRFVHNKQMTRTGPGRLLFTREE